MRPIQTIACALSLFLCGCSAGSAFREVEIGEPYGRKVDSVLSLMTLEEKIGQLNQYTGNGQATGPVIDDTTKIVQIEKGLVGSMLNIRGAERTRRLQEHAMKSRLRIPLLFGLDVIHGMQTVFPVPLAEASSFDLDLMRRTAAGAAREAAAQGVHWTFAPMVDISRDARWGRVVEGAGEDPWYGSLVARARVEGFQGRSLADVTTVMACAKHFAAYGACIAGKDYNTTDLSLLTLHDTYLPPFRAAVESGVGSVMNGFNDLNGIPATGNAYLQRTLLKGEWGFDGLTVSDWGSIGEMVPHGYAADLRDAARAAITAGCDVDMESRAYVSRLRGLVADGEVAEACIDDAVRRILLKKFQLGLFDDPFRYCDPEREARTVLCDSLRSLAREAAVRSIVLLKNDGETLPLDRFTGTVALIGALADSRIDMRGIWASDGAVEEVVTVREGLEARYGRAKVLYAEGYDLETNRLHLAPALAAARRADVVVCALPNTAETRGLLSREVLRSMKGTALLVNVGRGTLLDPDVLNEVLESGHLAGAVLDVTNPEPLPPDHPLWRRKDVLITPHAAGASFGDVPETTEKIVEIACRNLKKFLNGERPDNVVDFATGYRTLNTAQAQK